MRIIVFSDFHGRDYGFNGAEKTLAQCSPKPDLIVIAGDLANRDLGRAALLLKRVGSNAIPTYFVPGNMDDVALTGWSDDRFVKAIHGKCVYHNEYALIGLGGAVTGPFSTPFELDEDQLAKILRDAYGGFRGGRLILVSHCPPIRTSVDRVPSGEHAGSLSVRKFVEETKPILVVSGHIHEAQGIDKIGETTVVNPGSAQTGNYAAIELNSLLNIKFERF